MQLKVLDRVRSTASPEGPLPRRGVLEQRRFMVVRALSMDVETPPVL